MGGNLTRTIRAFFLTVFTGAACSVAVAANAATATEGYYRGPSLTGSTLVFSAEGDLWQADLAQGQAKRITTHPSLEAQAALSPDGQTIAYVANYSGTNEIYTIPISGGLPTRLTFEHAAVSLQHWVTNEQLLYSTNARPAAPSTWTLKTVNTQTLETETLPVADALSGYLATTGGSRVLYFVQFGIQMARDNTNFYRGGMRGRLWRFDLDQENAEAEPLLADHQGDIRDPMVCTDRLYFISDLDERANLWSTDLQGRDLTQVTQFADWPVREISLSAGARPGSTQCNVTFRRGADLFSLDLKQPSPTAQQIKVTITSDRPEMRERWIKNPLKYLTSLRYADEAEKVVVTARGKMALVGLDESRVVTVNTPTTSRSRDGLLSHDGASVYALNDQTGELEVWRFSADGSEDAEQLTRDGKGFKQNLQLSRDGKWLTYEDISEGLWLLNTETGRSKLAVKGSDGFQPFGQVAWSPDGQYFAVAHTPAGEVRPRILLYALAGDRQSYLTSSKYISRAPRFSRDGKWLYYLSERNFTATPSNPWLDRDFGTAFQRRSIVLANALTTDAVFPFAPQTELTPERESDRGKDKDEQGKSDTAEQEEKIERVRVAWRGLSDRLYQVPVAANSYSALEINKDRLFLLVTPERPDDKPLIQTTEVKADVELKTFVEDIESFSMSADGKKLVLFKRDPEGENHQLLQVPAKDKMPEDLKDNRFKTSDWQFQITPKEEWRQIFHDAWLMHRERFFDAALRGVDWVAIRNKYAPLLDRVSSRDELNDVFKQMMGELNALHSQVSGGDHPEDANRTSPGLLGAVLKPETTGLKIEHIYRYDTELPATAPPLARPDVDAQEGDFITAINGAKISSRAELSAALQNQVGKQVLLQLKRGRAEVQTVVQPVDPRAEAQLRYQDWVQRNRTRVEDRDAKLGYLHIQSMVGSDVGSFATEFHANTQKHGIIIDVRRNNGGNVDSWLISHLMREAWAFWSPPRGAPYVNMQRAFRGHLVVLADERTYSDGETFTAAVKHFGLADVIGRTTAGAGVWLNNNNRHSDGGIARVAQFPVFNMQGEWIVEGRGVSPTIEVINSPHATFNGEDAQLDAAVQYLQEKIRREPVESLTPRPFPEGLQPGSDVDTRLSR